MRKTLNRSVDEIIRDIDDLDSDADSSITQFNPTCWSISKGDEFAPSFSTIPKVPAGLYEIGWNPSLSTHVLKKLPVNTDELYELPSNEIKNILEDIEQFWTRRDTYRQYNFVHKRGILLYGEPGCGKSGIIQLCVKHIIEKMNGIVINIKDEDEIRYFSEFISTLRKIEPNRPLIVILEDIDSLAGEDSYSTTKLLNILDGIKQIENVVYIATTNYPEKLQERITNRPARFDRRYQVEMPSMEIRKAYLKSKLSGEDLKTIDINLWLKSTDGMSLSHLKELVISVIVMGKDVNDAIAHLTGLKDSPRIKRSKKMGF
jgi:SpoVK/Ycf46/Vps4 family AAA+-type ATPase